jgi:hypothetical protein
VCECANLKNLTLVVARDGVSASRLPRFFRRGWGIASVSYGVQPASFVICASAPQSSMNSEGWPMNTSARQGLQSGGATQAAWKQSSPGNISAVTTESSKSRDISQTVRKIRVRVDSGNRVWHEDLIDILGNHANLPYAGIPVVVFRVQLRDMNLRVDFFRWVFDRKLLDKVTTRSRKATSTMTIVELSGHECLFGSAVMALQSFHRASSATAS